MVLGYGDSIAYDQLVERITGHRPDKTHRFTDWSRRPLTADQMHYAVLRRHPFARRVRSTRRRPQEARPQRVGQPGDGSPDLAEDLRLSSRARLGAPENAGPQAQGTCGADEVAAWREQEAQSRDVPRSRVLKDDAVGDIATHAPISLERLASLRSLPKGFDRSKWGADIVAAVQRGLARDPAGLPKIEKPRGNSNGAAIVELLKVLLRMTVGTSCRCQQGDRNGRRSRTDRGGR